VLELAILGLLKEQELHGYELKKRLADTLGPGSGVSFGSLYPALGRLERAGAVRSVEWSGEGSPIPQTGSLGGELAAFRARPAGRSGRSRKVYAVTARGEALFEELLATESSSSDDIRMFNLRLAFARYLPADARIGMLERRRSHLLDRLSRSGSRARAGRGRIDAYLHSLLEHDRESAEHDLSWIERLIARERAAVEAASPTPAPAPAPGPASPPVATGPVVTEPAAPDHTSEPRPSLSGLRPTRPRQATAAAAAAATTTAAAGTTAAAAATTPAAAGTTAAAGTDHHLPGARPDAGSPGRPAPGAETPGRLALGTDTPERFAPDIETPGRHALDRDKESTR
jgi:DNA-binding PadR family transcriptional regulator